MPTTATARVLPLDAPARASTTDDRERARLERVPPTLPDELLFSNPMRSPDTLRFRLAESGATRIELTAMSGRHGLVLLDAPLRAGWHAVALPETLPPGVWFVRMRTLTGRITAMMVVTR